MTHFEQLHSLGHPQACASRKQDHTQNDEDQDDESDRKPESDIGASTQGLLDMDARWRRPNEWL